jgi:hypothetical protein
MTQVNKKIKKLRKDAMSIKQILPESKTAYPWLPTFWHATVSSHIFDHK